MTYHRVSASNLSPSLYPERDDQVMAAMERMKPYMVHLGPDVQFMMEIDGPSAGNLWKREVLVPDLRQSSGR